MCFQLAASTMKENFGSDITTISMVFNSSAVRTLRQYHSIKFLNSFDDSTSVPSTLLDATFFKGFCNTRAPTSTSYERRNLPKHIPPRRWLILVPTAWQQNHSKILRMSLNYYGGHIPVLVDDSGKESFIRFRISAWGAKRFMPCGVSLFNFPTARSYINFFNNKSAFYENLCHLESKCFPVGTHLPVTKFATFYLNQTGTYYRQAMIVKANITVDALVSGTIGFHNTYVAITENITEKVSCKNAKQNLCYHGLEEQVAVLRYLPSVPSIIADHNISVCYAMYDNTTLIKFGIVAMPLHNRYVDSEIIVIEPLTGIEDHHLIRLIKLMIDDPTITKHPFPIMVSLGVIIFFIFSCCLQSVFIYFIKILWIYSFYYAIHCVIQGLSYAFVYHSYYPSDTDFDLYNPVCHIVTVPISVIIHYHFLILMTMLLPYVKVSITLCLLASFDLFIIIECIQILSQKVPECVQYTCTCTRYFAYCIIQLGS